MTRKLGRGEISSEEVVNCELLVYAASVISLVIVLYMCILSWKEHFVSCWINSIFILCKLPWVQSFVSLSKSSGYRGECKMYIEVGNIQSNMDNCV